MEVADNDDQHAPLLLPPPPTSVSTSQVDEEHNHQSSSPSSSALSYRVNISISNVAPTEITDDVWSCLVVLLTFWFFASMIMILGFYGSVNLLLGPNSSRLVKTNTLFVQSIKVQQLDKPKPGPMLYEFHKSPPLDVEITWTETHNSIVPIDFQKEWVYFLNEGSMVDIFYTIKSPSSSPLSLVIAQGRKSLAEWIDDPSSPNSTLSWNIICGTGKIQQNIFKSSNYYIAVGNLNSKDVEVELKFVMKAFIYNTSQAYYKCSLSHNLCSSKLYLFGPSVAVLTSPGPKEGSLDDDWHVKVSYGPRWITYLIGSGVMTILIFLILRFLNICQASNRGGNQAREIRSERAPLLSQKDDDISSHGSSYDSISQDEQDLDELLAVNSSLEGKTLAQGENLYRLCASCFDARRDCFFLPCGHCVTCFNCGTRIAEETGTCPICRRTIKKVRKIFTV